MNNVISLQSWAKRRALHRQAIDAELSEADFFWLFDWKPTEWEGNEYTADVIRFPKKFGIQPHNIEFVLNYIITGEREDD